MAIPDRCGRIPYTPSLDEKFDTEIAFSVALGINEMNSRQKNDVGKGENEEEGKKQPVGGQGRKSREINEEAHIFATCASGELGLMKEDQAQTRSYHMYSKGDP